MPKERRLIFDVKDNKAEMLKALKGGFLGCTIMLFINYLIYCLEDASLFSRCAIFSYYSHGSVFNDVLGLWAVSFTPISSLSIIAPEWVEDFYIYLAPAMVGGLFIAINTKNPKWSLVSGLFFLMWGILLPLIFAYILPWFGIVDPTAINSSLISAFPDVYTNFNGVYTFFINTFQSVFLGWCFAGSIEYAGLATAIALPLSLLFGVLKALFSK